MAYMFSVHCRLELHQANPALVSEITQLQTVFPGSMFLESQRALAFYQMKGKNWPSRPFPLSSPWSTAPRI
jgi:anaphase-promoting complex subunit 8